MGFSPWVLLLAAQGGGASPQEFRNCKGMLGLGISETFAAAVSGAPQGLPLVATKYMRVLPKFCTSGEKNGGFAAVGRSDRKLEPVGRGGSGKEA